MQIYVALDLDPAQAERLRRIAGENAVHVAGVITDDAPVDEAFMHASVVLGNVPPAWIEASGTLEWIQLESVGFNAYRHLDWPVLGRRVTMTNLAGFFADPVAQSILAGILALYRGIDAFARMKRDADWVGDPMRRRLRLLTGATVMLFGYGAINRRLAALLEPFDCVTIHFGRGWNPASLDHAVAAADIVVTTVPETDQTIGVFDARRFSLMKRDALFVNFGRGSVVDEPALAAALEAGLIGGAVIDVTLVEPLPPDHPLWTAPNTIITQHTGGGTRDEVDRKLDVFEENLARFRAGEPLLGAVDFARGY